MPDQRPLNSYPDYYGELFRHVVDSQHPFRIWVSTPAKARTLRTELYNYRHALRDEVRKGRAAPETRELQQVAERIKLRVENGGPSPCLCIYVPEGRSILKAAYEETKQ